MKDTQTELLFDSVDGKKVIGDFTGGNVTSDAGLLLLRAHARQMRLFESAASAIRDGRRQGSVEHRVIDQLRQRVYQIAGGYFHGLDCNRLRDDPMFKVLCERSALEGKQLPGQSTQSRLENAVSRTDLYRLAEQLVELFVNSYPKAPRRITLDIDDTCDPTHGSQQLTLFNSHDDTYCYRPLHVYEGSSGKLVTVVLRPGKRASGIEALAVMRRVIERLRKHWPATRIHLRGDSHFCTEELMSFCESLPGVTYTFAMGKNAALARLCEECFALNRRVGKRTYRRYEEFFYGARSWSRKRRTIARVEVKKGEEDVRYVITNIQGRRASHIYSKVYCKRGQAENWIKDHKNALRSDLTSCHRFVANQFRVLLHSLAYVLLHHFRERSLRNTDLHRSQMDTIRYRLLKIGAQVTESARRIRFHLPSGLKEWSVLHSACAALDTG